MLETLFYKRARGQIHALQALRAAAALFVVAYHANSAFGPQSLIRGADLNSAFAFGHAGVILFFVISGFIICHVHWADPSGIASLRRYFLKRVIRLYPITTFVLLLTTIFFISFAHTSERLVIPFEWDEFLSSLLLVPLSCRYIPSVLWTLQLEVYFYILFSIAFLSRPAFWVGLFGWFSLIALNTAGVGGHIDKCAQGFLSTYNLLFFFGIAAFFVGRALKEKRMLWLGAPLLVFGGLAFAAVAVVDVVILWPAAIEDAPRTAWITALKFVTKFGYGIASTALVIGATLSDWRAKALGGGIVLLLGDASFSIYLIHHPLIGLLSRAMSQRDTSPLFAWTAFAIMMTASAAAGVALHIWVERPLMSFFRKRAPVYNTAGST